MTVTNNINTPSGIPPISGDVLGSFVSGGDKNNTSPQNTPNNTANNSPNIEIESTSGINGTNTPLNTTSQNTAILEPSTAYANQEQLNKGNDDKSIPQEDSLEYQLTPTGNNTIDAGIDLLKANGLTGEIAYEALKDAVQDLNPSKINKELLVEKLGESLGGFAASLGEQYLQHIKDESNNALNTVYKIAGSEKQWHKYKDNFYMYAPDYMKDLVRQQVESGNYENVAKLIVDYSKSAGTVSIQPNLHQANSLLDTGLSHDQFLKEYDALKAEVDANNDDIGSPKYANRLNALYARRKQGRIRDNQ